MNSKNHMILIIGFVLVIYSIYNKYISTIPPQPQPLPPKIVIPDDTIPNVPDLKEYILYDKYEEAKKLSELYNKSLILIFSAPWCQYCQDLKKDLESFDLLKNCIVCVLDTDKNQELVNKYKIKGLPTSIILQHNKEIRKRGYKYRDYNFWLKDNL